MKSSIRLENATPVIGVQLLASAIRFYVDVLGFDIEWEAGGLCGLRRDNAGLMLTEHESFESTIWMGCDDIVPIYERLVESGASILQEPTNQPWAHEFRASDGFGNTLWFGSGPLTD